jgi:hypothetical protein
VNTCDNIDGTVFLVPSGLLGLLLFSLDDLFEKLDVTSREKVKATINVNDLLTGQW